jgi:excisionase family DNA binding protein
MAQSSDPTPTTPSHQQRATDRFVGPRRGHYLGSGVRESSESHPRLTAGDVLTVGEVAELLHVPESTVGDWARRRVIPSLKIGRRRIFVRSKIEALILADDTSPVDSQN